MHDGRRAIPSISLGLAFGFVCACGGLATRGTSNENTVMDGDGKTAVVPGTSDAAGATGGTGARPGTSCDPRNCLQPSSGRACCLPGGSCGLDFGNGCGAVETDASAGGGGWTDAPAGEEDLQIIPSSGHSCDGLAPMCGPNRNEDCCAALLVRGGTFYRSYDGVSFTDQGFPATISDFALDKYEVTVGRFRRFVAAYSQNMIEVGSGKNPNNPVDPGWTWSSELPVDAAALIDSTKCGPLYDGWTDSPGGNENKPMNCLNWYEAFAFCIWDGGRLPTEAESNYAAAGGNQQRVFPWGNTAPDCTYANYYLDSVAYCVLPGMTVDVGSTPKGNGRWGQADLAGNVWEWSLDLFTWPFPLPCTDCANTTTGTNRVFRGGSFDLASESLQSARRYPSAFSTDQHYSTVGVRCARGR